MVKLLKNEWKRYRMFSLIMLIVTAGIGVLLSLSVWFFYAIMDMDDEFLADVASLGSMIIVALWLVVMPFAAGIYCLLSYVSDIGRKGMIFLTPAATWKIILSKLIFTTGMFMALYAVSTGGLMIARLIADLNNVENASEVLRYFNFTTFQFNELSSSSVMFSIFNRFIISLVSVLSFSATIMGCISLARFAANSTGVQVLLSILFYWIVCMIENTINTLVNIIFIDDNYFVHMLNSSMNVISWEFFASIVYAVVMYIICVCLTDRKVNLVS